MINIFKCILIISSLLLNELLHAQNKKIEPIPVVEIASSKWKLTAAYLAEVYFKSTKEELAYKIPKNYVTNFRSGPKILDKLAPQYDTTNHALNLAWLIHDVNYEEHLNRKQADVLLREMLLKAGIDNNRAWAIYWGLRTLGTFFYCKSDSCKNKEVEFSRKKAPRTKQKNMEFVFDDMKELDEKEPEDIDKVKAEIRAIFPDKAEEIIGKMNDRIE